MEFGEESVFFSFCPCRERLNEWEGEKKRERWIKMRCRTIGGGPHGSCLIRWPSFCVIVSRRLRVRERKCSTVDEMRVKNIIHNNKTEIVHCTAPAHALRTDQSVSVGVWRLLALYAVTHIAGDNSEKMRHTTNKTENAWPQTFRMPRETDIYTYTLTEKRQMTVHDVDDILPTMRERWPASSQSAIHHVPLQYAYARQWK